MTQEQAIEWFQEASGMLQQLAGMRENVAKIKGSLDLAERAENANAVMQLNQQLHQLQSTLDKVTPALLERCKVGDLGRAREYLIDLELRLEQSAKHYEGWRRAVVAFELAVALNEFAADEADGITRPQAEANLNRLKDRYETGLQQLTDTIPSSVRLLHV